jgi:hypothetical protein
MKLITSQNMKKAEVIKGENCLIMLIPSRLRGSAAKAELMI